MYLDIKPFFFFIETKNFVELLFKTLETQTYGLPVPTTTVSTAPTATTTTTATTVTSVALTTPVDATSTVTETAKVAVTKQSNDAFVIEPLAPLPHGNPPNVQPVSGHPVSCFWESFILYEDFDISTHTHARAYTHTHTGTERGNL